MLLSDSPKPLVKQFRSRFNTSLIASAGFILTGFFTFLLTPSLGVSLFMCGILFGFAAGYFLEQRELGFIEEKGIRESWLLSPFSFMGSLAFIAPVLLLISVISLICLLPVYFGRDNFNSYFRIFCVFSCPLAPIIYETRIQLIKRWQQEHQKEIIYEETSILSTRIYVDSKKTFTQA
jgi:hypothetical protein